MTHEQLEKAKDIECRINLLMDYIDTALRLEDSEVSYYLSIKGHDSSQKWAEQTYAPSYNDTPDFLKELLSDELSHIIDIMKSKVKKEISKLEKELSSI